MPNTISLFESIPNNTERTAQKPIPYLNTNYKDAGGKATNAKSIIEHVHSNL